MEIKCIHQICSDIISLQLSGRPESAQIEVKSVIKKHNDFIEPPDKLSYFSSYLEQRPDP